MLKLASTYLVVKDIERSTDFYSQLLEMEPSLKNKNRWVQFDFHGQCIALWHPAYDTERMASGENLKGVYSQSYIEYHKNTKYKYGNNFVLNFYVDDLEVEYKRLEALQLGDMTPIMYLDVACPYYLFMLTDPDGNQIEITGQVYSGNDYKE